MNEEKLKQAVELIKNSKHLVAFSGAGISVESGIPPFRGSNGLWSKVNPDFIDLEVFKNNPLYSWQKIKEIFYDYLGNAKPNLAHIALAKLEDKGLLSSIITQNIDGLHHKAGSKNVLEFHGTTLTHSCIKCGFQQKTKDLNLEKLPPYCPKCESLVKPDFIFFQEMINPKIFDNSLKEANKADVMLVIGTTGEVMPACHIPVRSKFPNKGIGSKIIEINPQKSAFTDSITDIHLKGKASQILDLITKQTLS